jgi:hypothetical protein
MRRWLSKESKARREREGPSFVSNAISSRPAAKSLTGPGEVTGTGVPQTRPLSTPSSLRCPSMSPYPPRTPYETILEISIIHSAHKPKLAEVRCPSGWLVLHEGLYGGCQGNLLPSIAAGVVLALRSGLLRGLDVSS